MKPLIPIATGRAVISSWRVTVGCVTQGRRTSCQLIKHGNFGPVWYIYFRRVVNVTPFFFFFFFFFNTLTTVLITSSLYFTVRRRPQVDIEEYNFLERNFSKTKPEERTWAKLVNLNTVHWYCDGPEPTPGAIKYEKRTRQRKSVILYI